MYDNLYMITPLVNSICSKDQNNDYCLKTIAKAAASSQRVPSTTKARRDLADDAEDQEEDDEEEDEADETVSDLVRRQSTTAGENLGGLYNETETTVHPTPTPLSSSSLPPVPIHPLLPMHSTHFGKLHQVRNFHSVRYRFEDVRNPGSAERYLQSCKDGLWNRFRWAGQQDC